MVCLNAHCHVAWDSNSGAQQSCGLGVSLAVSEAHADMLLLQGDLDIWPLCAQALHSKL